MPLRSRSAVTLQIRVVAVLIATVLAGAAVATVVVLSVGQVSRAEHASASRWRPAEQAATTLLSHLVDQESGERGFLLTGDPSYLAPFRIGQAGADHDIAVLTQLVAGDPALGAKLTMTIEQITTWRTEAARPELAARRAGNLKLVSSLVDAGTGKRDFDLLRARVADLQNAITARSVAEQEQVLDAQSSLRWALLAALIAAVVLVVAAAGLLRRWVLAPLRQLGGIMRRVAGGALNSSVEVAGPPELRRVAAAADAMRRSLVAELERAEVARQALLQRGPVVVGLSEQLRPAEVLPLPGLRVATAFLPAEGLLAGDWAQIIPLDDRRVAFAVADVSGHGADAGLEAVRLKHVVSTALRLASDPAVALRMVSDGMRDHDERFATLVIVVVDLATGELYWVNAGHEPPRVVGVGPMPAHGRELRALDPTGPLLCWLGGDWEVRRTQLRTGELLLVYTDGVLEARDTAGRQFGLDGVLRALRSTTVREVDTAVSAITAAVRAHSQNERQDDVTLMAVAWDALTAPAPQPRAPGDVVVS